ncbi:ArgE/DapE family deacylase [Paenibacillus sp. MMS18-CY102]|uniref:ArgE/DapE family deacylase n=1 Tax=Paenibacillus sp. MMS18-CY102 TaxID=2682849 RepID=UPI001F16F02F|nr:ArgE/DapE family deacylase [Paenibacillus sp. MMS18-CY102]
MDDKIKLLAWLDQNDERLYAMIQSLVRVPSDNPLGDCKPIAAETAALLAQHGFDPVRLPIPAEAIHAAGMQSADNIVAELLVGDGCGPVIVLNAHGDVVPPGEGWHYDPYAGDIVEGKLYGRGAAVSKSDIAVYTFAAMALRETGAAGAGKLVLAFTFDEETGGEIGPQRLLQEGQIRPDYAICAGFTHSIVHAHNGCLHLEVTVKGKSAHAAIPDTGTDAIEAMNGLLQMLYAHRAELQAIQSNITGIQSPTLNVGLINGGINTNVVPDRCTIRLDRRIIPEEQPEQAERELVKRLEEAAEQYPGVTIEIRRILLALPFGPVPESSPLIGALQHNASQLLGERLPIEGVPLYADARHFYEAGIPAVMFGAGPRTLAEANGHRADEHVELADVSAAVRIVALSLYDLFNLA